jgi:hypothetical protein
MTGLQSLLIDVDVNVSYAFYAGALVMPFDHPAQQIQYLEAGTKKNGRSF